MRAVFLHVLGDALNSLIVMVSALIVWFVDKDWVYYVDPGMSMIMVCIILSTTIPLLKEAALILLLTVPTHIQVTDIKEKMMNLDGIEAVHELHVWQLAGNRVIASAHIRCHNPHEYMTLAGKIKYIFHNEGIYSITIQPEFLEVKSYLKIVSNLYSLYVYIIFSCMQH
ncbi:proton-coupled zinc antiporter SLC30A1-like [Mercenaria mercenaria]|uniref:proton-coupled zinc antiporter SLC30A1-like n=1 Tax=Mercenaria mercenaria TaxID=6596 RepID=UPI00234F2212|nr:proton-coupled zinc antiporter SLC30A1-like [Mercenaria mercenaria]